MKVDRRQLLTGIGATVAAAALPADTFGYETEAFREAARLGLIARAAKSTRTFRLYAAPWEIKIGDLITGFEDGFPRAVIAIANSDDGVEVTTEAVR